MTGRGNILAFPDAAAIEAEAAAWVARFDAGDVSAKDQAAFQEWLNRSALHREAIAATGNLWSEFDALRLLTHPDQADGQERAQRPPAMVQRAGPWLAAAAAVVIAVAAGSAFFHAKPQQAATSGQPPKLVSTQLSYETALGGHRKITLADGSSVILNTDSRLEVNFSAKCRDVHLWRGEAYFDVVHDKARPFTVHANDYVVRDIGTAFDVHLSKAGEVEVGVTKGSVEVRPANGAHVSDAAKHPGILVAGDDIVLGEKIERAAAASTADLGRKLAWRQGELIYTGQPLTEVLADISRYSNIRIELADPALENLPVGGAFRTDQIEAIVAALENNFGVHAQWLDPRHVRLTSDRDISASGR